MNTVTSAAQTAVNKTTIFYHTVSTHPYTIVAKGKILGAINVTNQWIDYTIKAIPTIPAKMHSNAGIAIGVIVSTNILFFVIINKLTNFLQQQFSQIKPDVELNKGQKWFKNRVFDYGVLGGYVVLFNRYAIPYIFHYTLNNWMILATTITAVFARQFWRTLDTKKMNAHQLLIEVLKNQLVLLNIGKRLVEQQLVEANNAKGLVEQQLTLANDAKEEAAKKLIEAINQIKDLNEQYHKAIEAKDKAVSQTNELDKLLENANLGKNNSDEKVKGLEDQIKDLNDQIETLNKQLSQPNSAKIGKFKSQPINNKSKYSEQPSQVPTVCYNPDGNYL